MNVSSIAAVLGLAVALVFMLTLGLAMGLAVAVNLVRRLERAERRYRPQHGNRYPDPPTYPPAAQAHRSGGHNAGMVRPRDPAAWTEELSYA